MSERWPGGIVRSTPVTPTGPLQNGTAPGVWTVEQASYWIKQGLWPTAGNFLAVEDVFSTWLYTGNSSTQTITNGINLSGQGGMVWMKSRSTSGNNIIEDSGQGFGVKYLITNSTAAAAGDGNIVISSTSSTGFTLGNSGANSSGTTYASWTFREAANFFDVVTFTTNSSGGATLNHSLGVAPGMVVMKATGTTSEWSVYHRSLTAGFGLALNTTAAQTNLGLSYTATSSTFVIPDGMFAGNTAYVAYLYAHDTASDGIIQCGSFTAGVSTGTASVTLGWEPQWLLIKGSNATAVSDAGGYWSIMDNMRGMDAANNAVQLQAQSSAAESTNSQQIRINSTGFTAGNMAGSSQYIYIAIRRGPMRTPTLGTAVFTPIARNGTNANATITTGFTVDLHMSKTRTVANSPGAFDRLRGAGNFLNPSSSAAEDAVNYLDSLTSFANNTGVGVGADSGGGIINYGTRPYANWAFRRAPGFMDVVCYTGNASNRTVNHNLGVAPELMMIKSRSIGGSSTYDWIVYAAPTWGTGAGTNNLLKLNTTIAASFSNDMLNNTQPTSSVFSLGFYNNVNASGQAYVAYLFASCPGVSKVGSYTGNGSSQTINCGFTTGSRFVMIKRTDSAGDWYIWDSARGIVAGDDPYLALNSIAAEVTSNDSVDTDNSGFIVNQVAASDINVSAATYIFLAVA